VLESDPPQEVSEPFVAAASSSGKAAKHRLPEFDVVRAVVLLGVFTMNYIVQWNVDEIREARGWAGIDAPGWLKTILDPWQGPLSTRFAASLSMLVGVGISLLAAKSVVSGDKFQITADRWRLRRRGVLFILIGIFFDAVWPGEILHFTGVYLILGAWAIRWKRRGLVVAALSVSVLTAVQRVAVFNVVSPEDSWGSWWSGSASNQSNGRSIGTPRGFFSNILGWGGHPILPWMSFVFIGMAIGKIDLQSTRTKVKLLVTGVVACAAGYGLGAVGTMVLNDKWDWAASTDPGGFGFVSPFSLGMPAYVLNTIGSSLVVLLGVMWAASATPAWPTTRLLARAGKVTFTIYLAHGLIPWALNNWDVLGQNFGLTGSLAIAGGSWMLAMLLGGAMHRAFGTGPMEWMLRQMGGPAAGGSARSLESSPPHTGTKE
jgi:uncharacterized protein